MSATPQSWNRYAYVENDPINLSDPSGQGFWEDLGFAIADVFAAILAPEALPALGVAEGGATATTLTAEQIAAIFQAAGMVALVTHVGAHANTTIWGCAGGPCAQGGQDGSPTTEGGNAQGTGGPNAGTAQDGGASGQGPTGGGATATASGTNPTAGGGTGASIWDECGTGCMGRLSTAANFSAGAGDFLTAGITSWINRKTGAAAVINRNSGAYTAGVATGAGLSWAIPLAKAGGFENATVRVWRYERAGGIGLNVFPKGVDLAKAYRISLDVHRIAGIGELVPHLDVVWDGVKLLSHFPW